MNVYYWINTKFKESDISFFIPIPTYKFVIKSKGILPRNKRTETLRSKFLHPCLIEIVSGKLEDLPSISITEEEFVGWLGNVTIDQVLDLNDLGWLMKVKKDYENLLDKNKSNL